MHRPVSPCSGFRRGPQGREGTPGRPRWPARTSLRFLIVGVEGLWCVCWAQRGKEGGGAGRGGTEGVSPRGCKRSAMSS